MVVPPPPRPLGVQRIDFGRAEDLIEAAYTSRQSLAAAATGTVRNQIARLGPNSHAARSRSREPSARSAGHRTSESDSSAVASESADVRALSRTRRRGFTGRAAERNPPRPAATVRHGGTS